MPRDHPVGVLQRTWIKTNARLFGSSMAEMATRRLLDSWPCKRKQTPSLPVPFRLKRSISPNFKIEFHIFRCNQGYALDEHGITCSNIDECSIMKGVCGNGTCVDIPGSFTCKCDPGFEVTPMMQVCMDINECERTPGLCRGTMKGRALLY